MSAERVRDVSRQRHEQIAHRVTSVLVNERGAQVGPYNGQVALTSSLQRTSSTWRLVVTRVVRVRGLGEQFVIVVNHRRTIVYRVRGIDIRVIVIRRFLGYSGVVIAVENVFFRCNDLDRRLRTNVCRDRHEIQNVAGWLHDLASINIGFRTHLLAEVVIVVAVSALPVAGSDILVVGHAIDADVEIRLLIQTGVDQLLRPEEGLIELARRIVRIHVVQ